MLPTALLVCRNDSAFKVTPNGSSGNNYFFIVTALGKVGQSAGFYVNGEKIPQTVETIGQFISSIKNQSCRKTKV